MWSTVRLTDITTQQWNGSAYAKADTWTLDEALPATGDGTPATLWLSSITHQGLDTTAGGSAVTLPATSFADAGTSTMRYDAVGDLVESTDSRGKTTSLTYDALGRKTGEYAAPASGQSTSNRLASWVYDNANNAVPGMKNPIGQLTTETAYVDGNAYVDQSGVGTAGGFNTHGESSGESITIPSSEGALAGTYTYSHTYTNGNALPWRDVYPASPAGGSLPAETVTHAYKSLDLPASMGGLAAYTYNVDYFPDSQVTQAELGSNQGAHAFIDNTFDEHTGALNDTQLINSTAPATPIDETAYTYDPAGNPTRQTETRQGANTETQCYTYDALDRLKQAWTGNDACAADPATNNGATVGSGIGGAYWSSWTFNPLGQRRTQTQHGLAGAADTVTNYTYDGNSAGQADTLTSATASTGANSTFTYDKAGNTTQRTTPGHGQQTLTWNDAGELTAITGTSGGSSYIYDPDGGMLLQKDPGTTTLYLPGEQFALNTATGAVTGTRFYALPGGGEAVRTGSGTAYGYEVGDQQGTATVTLDNALTTPAWRQQTPYGAPRGTPPGTWPDNHGFLNQPDDTSVGLTDVGARWYDPDTGTFASLDPVFAADSPQQQNGYSYAAANPITGSDPTGEMVDCGTGHGGCGTTGNAWGSKSPGPCDNGQCDSLSTHSVNQEIIAHPGWHFPWKPEPPKCGLVCFAKNLSGGLIDGSAQWAVNSFVMPFLDLVQAQVGLGCGVGHLPGQDACREETSGAIDPMKKAVDHVHLGVGDPHSRVYKTAHVLGQYVLPAAIPVAGEEEDALGGAEGLARALRCDSFTGATQVPLADGSSKPIDQIKVGDKVADAPPGTDPDTPDQAHTVTAIHTTHTDHDYTDVTITTPDGPHTITGTNHHLYWDITTRAWTQADHLHAGDHLQTSHGEHTTITALHSHTATMATYNLTIDGLHTYYVKAGETPVLVHNCGDGTVARNALSADEYSQAQAITAQLGGHFEGQAISNEPGVDGTFDGIHASLKEIQSGSVNSVRALANTMTRASASAKKAGYSNVWLFVRAPGMGLADVSSSQRIPQIMQQGVISRVSVETSEGWMHFM